MTRSSLLLAARRLALAGSGATFLLIALASLAAPQSVARAYALGVVGVDAHNEFRAVFLGFWLGLAAAMLTAARRPREVLLGDACGLLVLAQASARVLSCAIDGVPSAPFLGAMGAELLTAALVFAGRGAARDAATQ